MGRLLEPSERQRFARYCRENAESCDAIARQMDAMPQLKAVAKLNQAKAMAYTIVASDLESVEDECVSG